MKKNNFFVWAAYAAGTAMVIFILSPLISWIVDGVEYRMASEAHRAIFMGLLLGTFLYFWDKKTSKKKR